MNDVVLHAFNWPYREIETNARAIAQAGYGAVLFPPPLYTAETVSEWWQRYQPKDYRILRSFLGNKRELVAALAALKSHGLKAYADIVFNHMANEFGARPDPLDFPGQDLLARYADPAEHFEEDFLYGNLAEPLFDERSFHPRIGIDDWMDDDTVAEGWLGGLPDLTLSVWVVKQQLACLTALNDLGFDGYRVDAIKHLPEHHIMHVFQHRVLAGRLVFGEALTFNEGENQVFLWPALRECAMAFYDFPLQQTMRRAFSPGGSLRELVAPAQYGRALPWDRAITFSVTHDVPNNDGFRGMLFDRTDEMLVNAYVLGRDGGLPLVYSDHGESDQRHPEDAGRWHDLWKRPDVVNMLRFHNELHGSPERCLYEHDGFLVLSRGDRAILAINKTAEWQTPSLRQHGLAYGDYQCLRHGHQLRIDADPFPLSLPPREAQLWVHEQ
jgi:alpha-amylase